MPEIRSVALGVFYQRINRDLESSSEYQLTRSWGRNGLTIQAALGKHVVLRAVGSYEPPNEDEDFPGRRYQMFGIGGGATMYPLISGPYRIGTSFSYYRQLWHDQSLQRYDKVVDGVSVTVQVERRFKTESLSALVWAAPAYIRDRLFEYQGIYPKFEAASHDNLGALGGASVALWGHVVPYVELGIVEHLQAQGGISYIY